MEMANHIKKNKAILILAKENIPFTYDNENRHIKIVNHIVYSTTIKDLFALEIYIYYNDKGELIIHGWD